VTHPSAALPRRERIASRRDFLRAYEAGSKVFSRYTVLFYLPNAYGHPRLGITTTKKVGKATLRNRLRRWTRETYRLHRSELGLDETSLDLVVNVKGVAAKASFTQYSDDLTKAFRRIVKATRA